jgi:hypothetical protein
MRFVATTVARGFSFHAGLSSTGPPPPDVDAVEGCRLGGGGVRSEGARERGARERARSQEGAGTVRHAEGVLPTAARIVSVSFRGARYRAVAKNGLGVSTWRR